MTNANANTKDHANSSAALAKKLNQILSDTYVLTILTHGYHWNVTGSDFSQLHLLFEGQYNALFQATDVIAERIRALGLTAEGSMAAFLENTVIKEASGKPVDAKSMLKNLHAAHVQLRDRLKETADFCEEVEDLATQDLMIQRMQEHDKTAWMLRSHLE